MTEWTEVGLCRTQRDAEQLALVLTAVGIRCRIAPADGHVSVAVAGHDAVRAREQLDLYERENTGWHRRRLLPLRDALHGIEAAMAYGVVLLAVFLTERTGAAPVEWTRLGAADAGAITGGEVWRTVTALTLHVDLAHLLSNLVFGMVAAVIAAQLLGAGLAWLSIVLAGTIGNALNAMIQPDSHVAVGASTAVFGALGILSLYRQTAEPERWAGGLRRWAPAAAGLMLLAFLGFGGERTDVLAHVAGFAVGGAIGWGLAHAPGTVLDRSWVQPASGLAAAALLGAAWLAAVSA